VVERVAQAHGGGRLALAGRRGADGRDEDQLALGPALEAVDEGQRELGTVVAEGQYMLDGNAQAALCQFDHGLERGAARDGDVGERVLGHGALGHGVGLLGRGL
jgi:hypothetical protein